MERSERSAVRSTKRGRRRRRASSMSSTVLGNLDSQAVPLLPRVSFGGWGWDSGLTQTRKDRSGRDAVEQTLAGGCCTHTFSPELKTWLDYNHLSGTHDQISSGLESQFVNQTSILCGTFGSEINIPINQTEGLFCQDV